MYIYIYIYITRHHNINIKFIIQSNNKKKRMSCNMHDKINSHTGKEDKITAYRLNRR